MKATDELLKQIKELNIEEFKKEESFDCVSIGEYLYSLLTSHDLQPKDIILNLNMERSYTYQILNGRRKPTRNFLLRIAIFTGLSLDETQKMLTIAQRPQLYPRNRFDAAIIFSLEHKMSLDETYELLEEIGEEPLNIIFLYREKARRLSFLENFRDFFCVLYALPVILL